MNELINSVEKACAESLRLLCEHKMMRDQTLFKAKKL